MVQVNIKKLDPRATLPTYGTAGAAGADLYALLQEDVTIEPGQTYLVHTGIALEIPDGYAGLVYPRSGLASKRGLAPANKVGVIDSDYRGEVMVALHNHSLTSQTITDGERIAQLVITPFLRVEFTPVETLSDTSRGAGGFGSTGTTVTLSHDEANRTRDYALRYYHGMGAPFDRHRAAELLHMAAQDGDILCRARLAYLSCIGDELADIPQNTPAGLAALASLLPELEKLVADNIPDAMLLWGNLLVDGYGLEKDEKRAAELYYLAAEAGYAPAANSLGQCYSFATGVKRDDLRAVSCYRRAADAGYAPAQFHLGVCYFNGQGVKVDKAKAADWYAAAAEQGYALAQFTLGKHYSQIMNGVKNDPEKGEMWLTRAAEQGLIKAMDFLADIYHHAGTNETDSKAARWYATAASRGDLYAMKQLSSYYLNGRGGISPDPVMAQELLRRAAEGGLSEAKLAYQELYGKL